MLHSTNPTTVNITQDDIDNGEQRGLATCPLARAIRREEPDCTGVIVDGTGGIVFYNDMANHNFLHDADKFITAFDLGEKVSPRPVILRPEF